MPKHSEDLQIPESKLLNEEDFEYLCFDLARELMSYGEPIPDYSTRDNALLASALGSPNQTFNKSFLYPSLIKQATILFYSLIKNHPFRNGNKRVAVMSLLAFLSLNKKWIDMKPYELYVLVCKIFESKTSDKDVFCIMLEKEFTKSLTFFPE
jgi:death-on-curing protein